MFWQNPIKVYKFKYPPNSPMHGSYISVLHDMAKEAATDTGIIRITTRREAVIPNFLYQVVANAPTSVGNPAIMGESLQWESNANMN